MEQGSSASALAARTAGMTDEQILDLDLDQITAATAPQSAAPRDDLAILDGTSFRSQGAVMTSLTAGPLDGQAPGLGALTSPPGTEGAPGEPFPTRIQDEPGWLKQLEAQPAAAAEARQWREAAQNVAALDAAYFSGDAGARSGLAGRLYESDPAAFREMLAESARMLASRDPQALAELARQLGMSETQAAPAKSLAQAARPSQAAPAAQNQIPGNNSGDAAFPAEAYRAFESATNDDVARSTREAIDRTLGSASAMPAS